MPLVRKPAATVSPAESGAAQTLQALRSADPEARWTAARAAAALPGGSTALAAALRVEAEPTVREVMFTALARAGTPASTNELVGFLRSDEVVMRTGALDALKTLGAEAAGILPRLLEDSDADIRLLSCELARGLPAEEATRLLCGLLDHEPEVNVCAAAIEVLAEVGTPAACPILAQCAARFTSDPFLGFAVKMAINRIAVGTPSARD